MKTSVKLQEPFSYAIWPVIVVGVIFAGYVIYLFVRKRMESGKHKKATEGQVVRQQTKKDIAKIKLRYIEKLEKIKSSLYNKELTTREAYQRMSMCIRKFVYEVTGIKVQNYTLEDIRQLNMPILEELIMEYYIPEFAIESMDNSVESIEKTKRAIEKWN
ncbi:MAG: hypothetical protein K2N51_01100 [Lachnospiraceae bacterium]|nr:hypothetical protein [Lachnospiraceae bacterium]